MLRGVYTALVTRSATARSTTRPSGTSWDAGRERRGWVVVCGSTGEAATLDLDERHRLVEVALEACAGSRTAVWWDGHELDALLHRADPRRGGPGGARAMIVAPYYNKPTQEGLYQHFARVAESTRIPLLRTTSRVGPG